MTDEAKKDFEREVEHQYQKLALYAKDNPDEDDVYDALRASESYLLGFGNAMYLYMDIARSEREWGRYELLKRVFNPLTGKLEFK